MAPLPAATLNTVPYALAPLPDVVVPRRLPLLSRTKPPKGHLLFTSLEDARVVLALLPAATLHPVHPPFPPRPSVVPKRLPLLSRTRTPMGMDPLEPLKEARVVMVLVPAATSNTVPNPLAPPELVVPKRLPLL